MDYFLSKNQRMLKDLCQKIGESKIKPVRARLDESGEFPSEIISTMAQAELFSVIFPEEYGGLGGGVMDLCVVVEELSKYCLGVSTTFAATFLGAYPLLLFGNPEQKKKFLPGLAAGEYLAAFGLTEPGVGSDAAGIATTARLEGNEYILNGTKQWITNGGHAGLYTVIASTDKSKGARGFSAFLVTPDDPGFSVGKKEDKMGIRCSATAELIFQDCRIPRDRLLGKEGMGFNIAMKTLDKSRPGVGAQGVGVAAGALEEAVAFAKIRRQFGQAVINFQAVGVILADMATRTEAARSLVYSVARYADSGAAEVSKVSAMAKMYATDVAMWVTTQAVQVMGGSGYMKDYPVEKMMRDAKILQIYEGTNQIQRGVISRELSRTYKRKKN
jgi:butyryl-CoA dehydrogenase